MNQRTRTLILETRGLLESKKKKTKFQLVDAFFAFKSMRESSCPERFTGYVAFQMETGKE